MNSRILLPALALTYALFAVSCGDDEEGPTGPEAGILTVTLTTPHADDGAILFRLDGPGMTDVSSVAPSLYSRFLETFAESVDEVTAVFVGDVASGPLLTFRAPDASLVDSYEATLLEVADRTNSLRESLGGYGLEVTGGP